MKKILAREMASIGLLVEKPGPPSPEKEILIFWSSGNIMVALFHNCRGIPGAIDGVNRISRTIAFLKIRKFHIFLSPHEGL
jgi:hypothetical protein